MKSKDLFYSAVPTRMIKKLLKISIIIILIFTFSPSKLLIIKTTQEKSKISKYANKKVLINIKKAEKIKDKRLVQKKKKIIKSRNITLTKVIRGNIAPKSVVHSGNGLFFAQNMMYKHNITVYNRDCKLVKIINDTVSLNRYGIKEYRGKIYKGSPVEAAFSHDGKFAWVSNYRMYGKSFYKPGCDRCNSTRQFDKSFIYKINTETLEIENVISVGSVPKYLAVTPNNKYVLVSNWSSGDLSIIDTKKSKEIKKIYLGRYPRGIAISKDSSKAYIALMGSKKIAVVNLDKFTLDLVIRVGLNPRHLCIDQLARYLYVSLNGEGCVVKIDLKTNKITARIYTGLAPRSMVISKSGDYIYVVNYRSNTLSKVKVSNMKIVENKTTYSKPIGISLDETDNKIWVACYSGYIMVLGDSAS
ncbi:MAG: YncE family protein [Spirochaetota bacterium]|nr:YncE family protein [Spirochaetota bacterium]